MCVADSLLCDHGVECGSCRKQALSAKVQGALGQDGLQLQDGCQPVDAGLPLFKSIVNGRDIILSRTRHKLS